MADPTMHLRSLAEKLPNAETLREMEPVSDNPAIVLSELPET